MTPLLTISDVFLERRVDRSGFVQQHFHGPVSLCLLELIRFDRFLASDIGLKQWMQRTTIGCARCTAERQLRFYQQRLARQLLSAPMDRAFEGGLEVIAHLAA